MAQFSEADINEAKRRVMEMRNRANRYTASSQPQSRQNNRNQQKSTNQEQNINGDKRDNEKEKEKDKESNKKSYDFKEKDSEKQSSNNPFDALAGLFSGEQNTDSSFVIILVLIMILSREGADNKLILALLYLLL